MTTSQITKTYTNPAGITHAFTFRADGWFNMTKAAQAFGRSLDGFMSAPETAEYAAAIHESMGGNSRSPRDYQLAQYRVSSRALTDTGLVIANRGRHGGTWAHPKLAIRFAQWLDVRFAVWCDAVIEDLLKGAARLTRWQARGGRPLIEGGKGRRPRRLQMLGEAGSTSGNAPSGMAL